MIKAWTKVRADSWDRYFRIRRILYKWKNPDLQVLWICSWRFKLESNHVPKFLATVTGTTSMLPTVRQSIFTLESCCFVPINMNSVLSKKKSTHLLPFSLLEALWLKPKNNPLSNAFFSGPPCSRACNTDTFQVVVYEAQIFSQCVMGRFLFLT